MPREGRRGEPCCIRPATRSRQSTIMSLPAGSHYSGSRLASRLARVVDDWLRHSGSAQHEMFTPAEPRGAETPGADLPRWPMREVQRASLANPQPPLASMAPCASADRSVDSCTGTAVQDLRRHSRLAKCLVHSVRCTTHVGRPHALAGSCERRARYCECCPPRSSPPRRCCEPACCRCCCGRGLPSKGA